jgi:hypothetical protein
MKVVPFLITGFVLTLVGVILYFVLNNLLSDFTVKQAQPGIMLFVGFAIVVTLTTAVLSGVAANYLVEKKDKSLAVAALGSIPVFVVVGSIVMIVGLAICVAVADAFRY